MRLLILLIFLVASSAAKPKPVTVTAQRVDTTGIVCTLTPSYNIVEKVSVSCTVSGVVVLATTYYIVQGTSGNTTATTLQYNFGVNYLTLMLYQINSAGSILWQASANGTQQTGSFF